MLDNDSGFGDIREDAEDFPELWKHIDDEIAREEAAAIKALQPVIKSDNNVSDLAKQVPVTTDANIVQEVPVLIDLTGDEDASETSSLCKSSIDLTSPPHADMLQARSVAPAAPLPPSQSWKRETTVS